MRKFVSLLTILIVSLTFIQTLKGATVTVYQDNLRYTVDDVAMTAELYGPVSSTNIITDLVIPDYIEYNGEQIPVTSIRDHAFSRLTSLRGNLTIGDNVQTIGDRAFSSCSGFTGSLTIGNSVQTIGNYAFFSCDGFTGSLTIPSSVQIIGDLAFYSCSGFTGSLTIPNSVQTIGNRVFWSCSGFTGSLTIGNSVQTIGDLAFYSCSGFTGSLTIPNSVQTIGIQAFHSCSGFTGELIIPESVKEIGSTCFARCDNLSSLVISSSDIKIYYQAFQCNGLKTVTCLGITPPECIYGENGSNYIDYVFSSKTYNAPLYVPAESINLYKNATEWKKFQYINPIQIEATEITLNKTELSLLVGQEETLIATLTPEDASTEIVWSVENGVENIVSVSQEGKVTALSKGTATIIATAGEVSASCDVTVYGPEDVTVVPGVGTNAGEDDNSPAENTDGHGSLTGKDLTLRINQTASIKLQLPSGLTTVPTLEWSIAADGTRIASVMKTSDLEAQFKGLVMGETTYSVKVAGTTVEIASGKVTVIAENPMTSLILNPAEVSVAQNADPFKIEAVFTPDNADVSLLNWTSSQPSVATVSNDGTVTILAQGRTIITATANDGSQLSATSQVTVTKPIDENFDFDFSDAVMDDTEGITIYLGETYQFKPKAQEGYVLPENISWSSDEPQIVSVTPEGLVKGEALGTATITASAMVNGKEVTATCVVKVIPIPASTLEIDGQGVKILKTTATLQLKATVMPENTTYADVTWQSSDPGVAQVSDQGLVTALSQGEVTITAFVTNQPTVKDEYKIQVQERLLGDANDNGVVNVADVGTISDYIVKKPVANFSFVNADVVPDNEITTADVTATIDIIFNDTPTVMTMVRSTAKHPMTGDRILVDDYNTNGLESIEIGVRLDNSIDYVGIQGSIKIPEDMTVERIERGPGAAEHILNYNITDDGNLIFILYSLDNLPLARGNDCLVKLIVKADESCEGIEIDNILASDINARQYTLISTGGTNNGFTSNLEEIGDRQIGIHSEAGCIIVSNAQGELVEIYTFDGKRMVGSTALSDKETYILAPGIYIVRIREINVKLVIK